MAHARAPRGAASSVGLVPRRRRYRWLAVGGASFGVVAIAWTAVALVAPCIVATPLSAGLNLRSEDPFAPKAVMRAKAEPTSTRLAINLNRAASDVIASARQVSEGGSTASAAGFMPPMDQDGPEIAEGIPLEPADSLAPSFGPALAYVDSRANAAKDDMADLAMPVVRPVQTVASLPAPPDAPLAAAEVADATPTGSLTDTVPLPPARDMPIADEDANADIPLPPSRPFVPSAPQLASIAPVERRATPAPVSEPAISIPFAGNRAAVYNIATHTVTLPSGERLEAHSGLGGMLDDPGSVHVRNRGATPPHTYDLKLREQLFHGVAALRLTPADGSGVYGRVGLLAHTYMLGPRGDSNGCVSFRDYSRFLRAYRNGEVNKLVVVAGGSGSSRVASARRGLGWWFTSGKN